MGKARSAAMIYLDVSRLLKAGFRSTPSGIDRMELAYATEFSTTDGMAFVACFCGRLYTLPYRLALAYVHALDDGWKGTSPARFSLYPIAFMVLAYLTLVVLCIRAVFVKRATAGVAGVAAAAPLQQSQPVVLYSFDPGSLAIVRVGVVSCLSATGATWADAACLALEGGCSAPMAIDRTGTAWVFTTNQVSSSQTVQRVNTADASCVGSAIPLAGPDVVVASAFSSPGSSAEKLYIMLTAPAAATITLGQFDTQGLTITGGTAVAGLPDFPPSYYGYGGALAADSVGHLLFTDSPGAGSWYSSFTIYEIDPSVPTTLLSTQVNPPDEGYRTWMISAFWGGSLYSFPSWGNQNGSGDNVQAAALSSASVIQVLPELGASVFSASSGTACAPAASTPHPM